MESSVDEQLQTAADDSLRSDSIPSLPDEKGNSPCIYTCGKLEEERSLGQSGNTFIKLTLDSFAFVVLLELSSGPCAC